MGMITAKTARSTRYIALKRARKVINRAQKDVDEFGRLDPNTLSAIERITKDQMKEAANRSTAGGLGEPKGINTSDLP